jgi:hypothetical protein
MWQIKYQNEFFDLAPNQSPEITRNSPLFWIDNNLQENSTPFTLAYTDKNSRLLGHYFFEQTRRIRKKIDVEVYQNNSYSFNATMVIEGAGMNNRHNGTDNASGYLLFGISHFFQQIKDKLLSDLVLGGDRNFSHTTEDPTDGSGGFWQHFNAIFDFSDDYVMVPYRNDAFVADDPEFQDTDGWGNAYDVINGNILVNQPVIPFTKVEYILQQIFAEAGWKLDTSGINDEEWKRLLLYSNYTISTYQYRVSGSSILSTPMGSVTVNLAQAMPPGKTCSSFIFGLCKRYFWAPLFDLATSTCRIVALKEVPLKPVKDWTRYASPASTSEFTIDEKIFAFKNNYGDDDQLPSAPDFTPYVSSGFVQSKNLLLPPEFSNANNFCYAFVENKWYISQYNADTNTNQWVELADNIYDYEPDGATDTFETDITTLPLTRVEMYSNANALFPHVNQAKKSAFGMRTVIYHGMVHLVDDDGSPLTGTYPYASCTNTPPAQEFDGILPWSNIFSHDNLTESFGIKDYWAKRWTQAIAEVEEITRNFYLPFREFAKFVWDDIIAIQNIPYLIKSTTQTLNQAGELVTMQARLQPLIMVSSASGGGTTTGDAIFDHTTLLNEDSFIIVEQQYLSGPAGATLTIKVIEYASSSTDFIFKINGAVKVLDDTFTVTLNSSGVGSYNMKIDGTAVTSGGIVVKVQIISTDTGAIGTPDTSIYSKTR